MRALLSQGLVQLDVEFGNVHGFFSGSKSRPVLYGHGRWPEEAEYEARIELASLLVRDEVELQTAGLHRTVSFTPTESSALFDMVSRYVVIDQGGPRSARINGIEVPHRSANLYRQYPARTAMVPVGADQWLSFSGSQSGMPSSGFEHVFYVRDERQGPEGHRWIVHHRVVATELAQMLKLRGCNPRFEGPAPAWLNEAVPRWLHRKLFRIRERRFPGFPVMTIGENTLALGDRVTLASAVTVHQEAA